MCSSDLVGNGAVALCVPDLGVALVLAFHKSRVVGLVELTFHLREGRRQIIRVLWVESRTETVETVPVDVALGSFRVDVLAVGKVETAVISHDGEGQMLHAEITENPTAQYDETLEHDVLVNFPSIEPCLFLSTLFYSLLTEMQQLIVGL